MIKTNWYLHINTVGPIVFNNGRITNEQQQCLCCRQKCKSRQLFTKSV